MCPLVRRRSLARIRPSAPAPFFDLRPNRSQARPQRPRNRRQARPTRPCTWLSPALWRRPRSDGTCRPLHACACSPRRRTPACRAKPVLAHPVGSAAGASYVVPIHALFRHAYLLSPLVFKALYPLTARRECRGARFRLTAGACRRKMECVAARLPPSEHRIGHWAAMGVAIALGGSVWI